MRYNNKNVILMHLRDGDVIEQETVKVPSNGVVQMNVKHLSPFMIVEAESANHSEITTQEYIEIGGICIIAIILIGCTIAIVKSKKNK